jgi:hypothetical protein
MKTVTYDENEWQLVPKISTSKMEGAGEDAYKDNGHCDCGNYDGCSMEEVYSAMLAVAPAAQDSAPAELPPASDEWFEKILRTVQPDLSTTSSAWARQMSTLKYWYGVIATAPASPQPVAKVLNESDIHAIIDSLPESAFEPTIAIGEITALFDDDNGEDEEVLEAIKAYAKIVAFRALAASTPTTLAEEKE